MTVDHSMLPTDDADGMRYSGKPVCAWYALASAQSDSVAKVREIYQSMGYTNGYDSFTALLSKVFGNYTQGWRKELVRYNHHYYTHKYVMRGRKKLFNWMRGRLGTYLVLTTGHAVIVRNNKVQDQGTYGLVHIDDYHLRGKYVLGWTRID